MDLKENGKAILAMLVAMAAFIGNDALVKIVYETVQLGQIIVVRGIIAIVMILVLSYVTGVHREFRHLGNRMVFLRSFGEVGATLCYLIALMHMPIANITAILQVLPLMVTGAAAIFLGAPVGWRRWTAIGVGFAGVLIIVRPGLAGFDQWSILALIGILFMVLRDLTTRMMPVEVPTFGVTLVTCAGVLLLGFGVVGVEGWEPMSLADVGLLTAAATCLLVGYVLLIVAMRIGDISLVSPFRYSIIVWAILIGYFVWGDVPDALTMLGTAIVVATGIYTVIRERRVAQQAAGDKPR
ncbi:DMT family transporter [Pannonibacter sp.]|uniref:DMT family transporter n=1 Tax=Pannonibacter sp. TaxID=1906786 RepID=UPI003F6F50F4